MKLRPRCRVRGEGQIPLNKSWRENRTEKKKQKQKNTEMKWVTTESEKRRNEIKFKLIAMIC